MKARKAMKRVGRIEALVSEVTDRFSAATPQILEVLEDVKNAVARLREAVTGPAPPPSGKKKPAAIETAASMSSVGSAHKTGAVRKKAPAKKAAATARKATEAKKRGPIKKVARPPAKTATSAAATPVAAKAGPAGSPSN